MGRFREPPPTATPLLKQANNIHPLDLRTRSVSSAGHRDDDDDDVDDEDNDDDFGDTGADLASRECRRRHLAAAAGKRPASSRLSAGATKHIQIENKKDFIFLTFGNSS